jgi:predicted AAA+ superfamily ATPase
VVKNSQIEREGNRMMHRYLETSLSEDLNKKILLLTGPRQCGKTTLSKMLIPDFQYINYDLAEHRLLLMEKGWDREKALIIFDELHKMNNWKSWLKGIYDVEGIPPALLVTGSARLAAFRKTGDSLAGRHFQFRLHPIDFKEAVAYTELDSKEIFNRLMAVGGFPEPFLNGTTRYYNRWKRSHIDLILREDLITLSAVRDIQSIETLIELLRSRVGSLVSSNSLARDLQKSPNTIQSWLKLLEDLYVIFRVTPYHKNIARGILKEPKFYFYDNGMVIGDDGIKLENLVACALLKELHRCQDVEGENLDLHFIRNKEGQEIDFLITCDREPQQLIEVKWSDDSLSPHFKKFLPKAALKRTQVVGQLQQSKSFPTGERIEPATKFLSTLCLAQ